MNNHLVRLLVLIITVMALGQSAMAQTGSLPYAEIPACPDTYTAATVTARMIDGVGFRYYWATEGLRPEDLAFRPNAEARTTAETLDHILSLSKMILNSVLQKPNIRGTATQELSFSEKRTRTLNNLKQASDILKTSSAEDLKEFKIIFKNGDQSSDYPFWNQLNGPIADALWHIGQVVSFRRSSGNPFDSKVNVFTGKRTK